MYIVKCLRLMNEMSNKLLLNLKLKLLKTNLKTNSLTFLNRLIYYYSIPHTHTTTNILPNTHTHTHTHIHIHIQTNKHTI